MTRNDALIAILRDSSWSEAFRGAQLGIRLSEKEKREIERAAERARRGAKLPALPPSTWARAVLLMASRPQLAAVNEKDQPSARLDNGEGSIAIRAESIDAPGPGLTTKGLLHDQGITMSPQAQAKYDRAIASILRHGGVKQLDTDPEPPKRTCPDCGATKSASEFHPETEMFNTCISCWLGQPGQGIEGCS